MMKRIRCNTDYVCMMKDCSMAGKYPVAALIILEKNTGKYGVKLGCHPDFGIAMERTLTEAAQGQDIYRYAGRSIVDFSNNKVSEEWNICNTFKIGNGQFPYQVFGDTPTYPFTEVKDVSNMTNQDIIQNWVKDFLSMEYDILVRDVSYLGFPSVQIIIPGFSEMYNASDSKYISYNTRNGVMELLSEPENINKDNVLNIISTMEHFSNSIIENTINSYYLWYENVNLPCANIDCGCDYFIAMCHYYLKDYSKPVK